MRVPFVDLHAQYEALRPQINSAIQEVIDSTAFVGGAQLSAFEAEFAAYCASELDAEVGADNAEATAGDLHCVGCANGTDALYLALRGLEIGAGDEVITVAHTFIA